MKGGTVKSNKGKQSFRGPNHGGFGKQKNQPGGWQGMGNKSILSQLKQVEQEESKETKE